MQLNDHCVVVPERLILGLLLSFTGGFLDAYTYILRGGVFSNAQTGNIVLLGISAAQGQWQQVFYLAMPILAFVIGVFATEWLSYFFRTLHHIHWRQIVLLVELLILLLVGFLPRVVPDTVINTMIAFVCSMQVNSFRRLSGMAYSTTMCTGNLRSAVEHLSMAIAKKDRSTLTKSLSYWYIILMFAIGAAAGALLCDMLQMQAIWVCCAVLLVALLYLFYSEESVVTKES